MSDERHTPASSDRVPWNQLVAYGMGGLIPIALFNIAPQLMSLLGNISLGLSPLWLGLVTAIPRLWDAVSDPIMGHISDNTRTRWGRRRPYILLGGIAVALTFMAMWWVPRGDWVRAMFETDVAYDRFQLSCILGAMVLFFTATTVFEIPHGALGMEMSGDYHERTRLFSAKSFLGNLFAMGNSWLILIAGLSFFRGAGGDLVVGMRYVSIPIGIALIAMSYWWFLTLREPGFAVARQQVKTKFWEDMRSTATNRTFLKLVAIIFTLAMGFNFVQIFNQYITIFYVYGGDVKDAGALMGVNGTVWAVTGLVAVFPLNWISKRVGKSTTLAIAIMLMCGAQLSKIVCYNREFPYLIIIPTVLLSAGMLMFFTLGASMVGDVCDEDELRTGTRSEGSFYSVYWWFIKMGSAVASVVMGALLVFTGFNEKQAVAVERLNGSIAVVQSDAETWAQQPADPAARAARLREQLDEAVSDAKKLRELFDRRVAADPQQTEHVQELTERLDHVQTRVADLHTQAADVVRDPKRLGEKAASLSNEIVLLKQQPPQALFRLRVIEIGLPLALSVISLLLTLRYPLTEARSYEIKEALQKRHAKMGL